VAPNDLRRIVRALEVFELTGVPISTLHQRHQQAGDRLSALLVGIEYPREELYERINRRVDRMIEQGWIDEVQRLIDNGYEAHIHRLKSLGYREIAAYLRAEQTLEQALEQTKMFTRRFAKRQLSWYRGDTRVRWIPAAQYPTPHAQADLVMTWLR
jgi:tRNA dimethylallyltransferase